MKARPTPAGFTIVELMIVVVIIGILAALAVTAFSRIKRHSERSRFASDLRTFAGAFEIRAMDQGGWPATTAAGVPPPEMVDQLRNPPWEAPTSLGGQWKWDRDEDGVAARIHVVGASATTADLREIDQRIDDGNLATGIFRHSGSSVYYILQR